MAYITAEDAPEPRFMVVAVHTEYEQTVRLFVYEQAARDAYALYLSKGNEAYITKILA